MARYRVLKRLGAGAAGGVYLVEDRVLGGPPVALKRVEASSDPTFRDSFAREFAVLSSLSLPGVAQVFDLGVIPADAELPAGPFFTRSYVDGAPLDAFAAGHGAEECFAILLRVLDTVGQLHRHGIVHGDIKPANVIVDTHGQAHLIDFGLASRGTDAERLRGSGTPGYMAPELFRGAAPSVAADIYALGATLWTLATGQAPLEELGERAVGAKLRGELPRIPATMQGVRRTVLEAALWALADDPRERAPSADELLARLERALWGGTRARMANAPRAFVPPRARGRDGVWSELERCAREASPGPLLLLEGARGMGKSTVLRELKWRLQLGGFSVIELRCSGGGLDPLAQLLRQAIAFAGEREPGVRELAEQAERGQAARDALVQGVVSALGREAGEARIIVLVDDLDDAEALLSEALRLAVHSDATVPPVVIASAQRVDAAAVDALGGVARITLEPLSEADAAFVIAQALGPVDHTAQQALLSHAAGNPGVLVEALTALAERDGLTAEDVERLSPGEIGSSLARAKLEQLPAAARTLAAALAAVSGPLPLSPMVAWLGGEGEDAVRELVTRGLARTDEQRIVLIDGTLAEWLRAGGGRLTVRDVASALLASTAYGVFDVVARAELALVAEQPALLREHAGAAFALLSARGAHALAARLYEACLVHAAGEEARELRLALGDVYTTMGEYVRAAEHVEPVLDDAQASQPSRSRARVCAGRALVAAGRFERAIELLSGVSDEAPRALRAQAARELARVHLRRGASEAAKAAVDRGLDAALPEDTSRAELLAIDGMLASMRGDRERAHQRYELAVEAARRAGVLRDEAQVLGYRALSYEREGELERARDEYAACLSAARAAGDIALTATFALNLGNVSFRSGHHEGAEAHFTLAARLSRRAGRTTTALLANNNLAHLHVYLGTYARARSLAETSLAEAERLGVELAQAHALQILADIEARTHETESGLARYETAATRYKKLGRSREVAEVLLDAAEVLLDRAGVSDGSAAAAKLAAARELVDKHGIDDFRVRLKLLLARARAHNGDVEGALAELERLEGQLGAHERELRWQMCFAQAKLHRVLGSELLCAKKAREGAELIEGVAAGLPRDAREAFRADPRRREALEFAAARDQSSPGARTSMGAQTTAFADRRFERLLEIIKRLAREHDLDRLLERITDSAVELSGAERGFVLLVDEKGQLAAHTVRGTGGAAEDPHVAFSQSIAEAVLIDGEPILTVNARDDRRVNEFMSVHKLMLKSVACIPINGPRGPVGVLYLEHRLRAGRFQESDLDLLVAFGDQTAIALENARLWAENERRRKELELKNEELAQAKAEVERLLEARTEELEEARRDLGRARAELEGQHKKHGIVGQSAAMRRVFALIDRVQDTNIPVVIQGESGTGKELVARAVHFQGARKAGPFVAVNCAALPEQLLESELFGHIRGAFTGADRDKKGLFVQAHGGTLFLDEFADMPMRMQIDLLRVLQEGKIRPVGSDQEVAVDVRVVAATNRPLMKLVADRKLREDLYYRLSVVEIRLPPLRERAEDIPILCDHILSRIARQDGSRPRKLSRGALESIIDSGLPGNVRQLEHLLLSAAMMADGAVIEAQDLPLEGGQEREPAPAEEHTALDEAADDFTGDVLPADLGSFKNREKQRILSALEAHGWNRAKAALALNMPRRTFYRRLTEFGIL
jgi:transcriptional regulator with GAF, ATPase, and Fis domain/tetratricopeptide (TPR) repeat protein/predicted Ser/Thr protein kinase